MPVSRRSPLAPIVVAAIAWCLALPVAPASAQAPAWVQFAPPASVGLHVRDSRRDREIFFDEQGLLAVPDRPTIEWQRIWSGTNPASPQRDRAFYDAAQDRIWTLTSTLSDTLQLWSMDLASEPMQWVRQSCAWAEPGSMIMDPALAFDPVRDRIVAFGGYAIPYPFPLHCNQCGSQTNAVFTLALAGTPIWTRETMAGPAPGGRESAVMVHDPWRDRMVVYGGVSYGPVYYDETWALSPEAPVHWTQLNPTHLPPSGHSPIATALLDSLSQRWIVDGWGLDLSSSVAADAADWTQLPPYAGPYQQGTVAWFEQHAQSRLVFYGGDFLMSLSLGPSPGWSLLAEVGRVDRFKPVSFVDAARERVYAGLGVGQESGGELDDSFKVRPLDRDEPWTPVPAVGPSWRMSAVAAVDAAARRALVFGGGDENSGQIDGEEFSDLWAFDLDTQAWSLLASGNPPIPRTEALGVFDPVRRRLIVHGGRYTNPSAVALSDTWVFDAVTGSWSSPPTGSYGGVWAELGVYDPVRDRVISFGGAGRSSQVHVLPLGPTIGTWSELAALGTPPFASSLYHAAAYDSLGDRVIVVGEKTPGSTGVWALTLTDPPTWSELSPSGAPPPSRYGAQLVGDPERGRVVLIGGSPVTWGRNQFNDRSASDDWALYLHDLPAGSFMSTNVLPGAVTLRWHASESGAGATVYRRGDGTEWQVLGRQVADESGLVTWSDHGVVGGASYDYRLGVYSPRGERVFGETRVSVPIVDQRPSQLSLEGLRPNPTEGPLIVAFSLAEGGETSIELIDLAGRRVLNRDLGDVDPGPHTVRLDAGGPHLASGLYFIRMHHAGHVLSKKAVLGR